MSQYVLFLILGLSVGAVYAALALGIVVTYQGTGVINFAAAAMATVPLYVYDDLKRGMLTLPLPWLPSFEWGTAPTWLAIVVSLAVAAALAAFVHVAISRPLRNAPALAKVVAAVGVMLTLQAAAGLKYGTEGRARQVILPTGTWRLAGINIAVDRLWLLGIVVLLGGAMAIWFRRSRTGLSIQAAAENERAASFARLSPHRLGLITWILATVFVTFVMIVGGPVTGVITPTSLTLLVVPALAAALIGRLQSLWGALLGGLALGVLQSELQFLSQTKPWWPDWAKQGLQDAFPFVVIVVTLFVLGRSIPMRGDDTRSSLPPVILPRNRPVVLVVLAVLGLASLLLTSGSYRFGIITTLAMALVALSLVVLTGMVGQISLAQAAFAGVAALLLSKIGTSIPFPLSMIVAALGATVAGVVVGLPALRIRGAQLAVVTLAAALTLEKFVFANPKILSSTADVIPSPSLLGIDLSVREGRNIARLEFGIFVFVVVFLAFVLVGNVMRGGSGRKMLAVRSNERAAASIGIPVAGIKLFAFAIGSFLAGLGGALIGYSRGQLSSGSFGVFVGLGLLATAYLGGITSASGAVWAGVLALLGINYVILDRLFSFGQYYAVISGIGLILTVLVNPVGIAGKLRSDLDRLRRRKAPRNVAAGGTPRRALQVATTSAAPRNVGEIVLRADDVTVSYGGLRAVDRVSLEVRAGEIVGLIGPNGAGKTSFVDAITGFTACTGDVEVRGRGLGNMPAHRRARHGLVRTWQSVELFEDLSVEGNVRVADDIGNDGWRLLRDTVRPNPTPSASVLDAMRLMSLEDVAERRPSELPLGRQKALGVARALAMQPAVLLLDEPAAGLDMTESAAFGDQLRQIASTGVACLLIDHDMHLVLGVCDRVYVIEFGRQIAEGRPEHVRRDPRVVAAYLGSEHLDPEVTDEGALAATGELT